MNPDYISLARRTFDAVRHKRIAFPRSKNRVEYLSSTKWTRSSRIDCVSLMRHHRSIEMEQWTPVIEWDRLLEALFLRMWMSDKAVGKKSRSSLLWPFVPVTAQLIARRYDIMTKVTTSVVFSRLGFGPLHAVAWPMWSWFRREIFLHFSCCVSSSSLKLSSQLMHVSQRTYIQLVSMNIRLASFWLATCWR